SFLQLRVGLELLGHTGANTRAALDLVDILQDKHPLKAFARQSLDVRPFLRISLDVSVDLGVDFDVIAVLRGVGHWFSGGDAAAVGILLGSFKAHGYLVMQRWLFDEERGRSRRNRDRLAPTRPRARQPGS